MAEKSISVRIRCERVVYYDQIKQLTPEQYAELRKAVGEGNVRQQELLDSYVNTSEVVEAENFDCVEVFEDEQ